MALSGKQRRELIASSHQLDVVASISAGDVSKGAVAHVRAYLATHDLAKVRIQADGRAECEQAANELAARVPCEIVARIGRIVLLSTAPQTATEARS